MRQPRQKFAAAEQASGAPPSPRRASPPTASKRWSRTASRTQAIFVTGGERFAPIPDSTKARRAVTDRIIVMHRGRKVAEKITARTNAEELVQYMVGAREDAVA